MKMNRDNNHTPLDLLLVITMTINLITFIAAFIVNTYW